MKFNDNRLKGSGDKPRTRNLRVNPLTLSCDLDIESRKLNHMLCTVLPRATYE